MAGGGVTGGAPPRGQGRRRRNRRRPLGRRAAGLARPLMAQVRPSRSPEFASPPAPMGKDESPEAAGLLLGGAAEAPPSVVVVDAPSFFVAGPRVRRDFAWGVAFFGAFALSLILGAVAASQANPAFDVLSSPSALAVRSASF